MTTTTLQGKHEGPPIPVRIFTGVEETKDERGDRAWMETHPEVTAETNGVHTVGIKADNSHIGKRVTVTPNDELPMALFETYELEICRAAQDARDHAGFPAA